MVGRVTSYRALAWAVSFRSRDFRWLWVSILLYSVGTGMEHVAVGWLVFEVTGSSFMVGVASAARMAPSLLPGDPVGHVERQAGSQGLTPVGNPSGRRSPPPGWPC